MSIKIGDNIKHFRKIKGVTQEQLAEAVGVSFQAVSKWENSIALPDITLVPLIAGYFGVSTDEILGYNLKAIDDDINRICTQAFKYRETNAAKGRQIIEEGLRLYPDNDILLDNLLYVLNYSTNPDETIYVASKLVSQTNRNDLKYDALRFLAYAYNAKGDSDLALSAIEQIPQLYFTKLSEMAFILDGKPKFEAANKQKWISFETILQMMWKNAEYYESNNHTEMAITETKKALALIDVFSDDEKISDFYTYKEFFINKLKEWKSE